MAYYFLYPEKDTTIYSHPYRTDLNTGRVETLALAFEANSNNNAYYPSRTLLEFNNNEIYNTYKIAQEEAYKEGQGVVFDAELKLWATDYESEFPATQNFELYPIYDEWVNGTQRYIENPYYSGITSDGASWLYSDNGIDQTPWTVIGNSFRSFYPIPDTTDDTRFYFEDTSSLLNYVYIKRGFYNPKITPNSEDVYVLVDKNCRNCDAKFIPASDNIQEHVLYYADNINDITGSTDRLDLNTYYGKSFTHTDSFLTQKDLIFSDPECTTVVPSGSYLRQGNNIFGVGPTGSLTFYEINIGDTPRGIFGRRVTCYGNASVMPIGGIDTEISDYGGTDVATQMGPETTLHSVWCCWLLTVSECCNGLGYLSLGQVLGYYNPDDNSALGDGLTANNNGIPSISDFTDAIPKPTPNKPTPVPLIISGLVSVTSQGIPVWDTPKRALDFGRFIGYNDSFEYTEGKTTGYIAGTNYQNSYEIDVNFNTYAFIDNSILNHLQSTAVTSKGASIPTLPIYQSEYNTDNVGGGSWYYGEGFESTCSINLANDLDLKFNIRDIIYKYIAGFDNKPYPSGIPNNGFIIKRENDVFDTKNKTTVKYFGSDTHTIFSPTLALKWDDSSYITGSNNILNDGQIQVHPYNLKPEYKQNEEPVIRLNVREQYPTRTFTTSSNYLNVNYLTSASYYSIEDYTSKEVIIPFDTTYTKLSADNDGMYFKLRMQGLQPERHYRLLIRHDNNDGVTVYDDNYYFKVIR